MGEIRAHFLLDTSPDSHTQRFENHPEVVRERITTVIQARHQTGEPTVLFLDEHWAFALYDVDEINSDTQLKLSYTVAAVMKDLDLTSNRLDNSSLGITNFAAENEAALTPAIAS